MKTSNLKIVRIAAAIVFVLAFMLNIHTNLDGKTILFGQQLIGQTSGTETGTGTTGTTGTGIDTGNRCSTHTITCRKGETGAQNYYELTCGSKCCGGWTWLKSVENKHYKCYPKES